MAAYNLSNLLESLQNQNNLSTNQNGMSNSDLNSKLNLNNNTAINNQFQLSQPEQVQTPQIKTIQQVQLNPLEQKRFQGINISANNPYRSMANQYLSKDERSVLRQKAIQWEDQNSANNQNQLNDEQNRWQNSSMAMGLLSNAASDPKASEALRPLIKALTGNIESKDLADFLASKSGQGVASNLMNTVLGAYNKAYSEPATVDQYKQDLENLNLQGKKLGLQKTLAEIAKLNRPDKESTKENPDEKDYLLMAYPQLNSMVTTKDTAEGAILTDKKAANKLASQYSAAIRENIGNPKKAKQYIDRYNYLTGKQYTYEQWAQQAGKKYNPESGKPVIAASRDNKNLSAVNSDAQSLAKQLGGAQKAISYLKQQGAKDNDPLIVALKRIRS